MGLQPERNFARNFVPELSTGAAPPQFVLGSRSPRRLELLRQIVPAVAIEVVPPSRAAEAGFAGLETWPAVERRLEEIVLAKSEDVFDQLATRPTNRTRIVIAADTVVVVRHGSGLRVLGQPPDDPSASDVVRRWFREYYAGKTHTVATGLRVTGPSQRSVYRIVKSSVSFYDDVDRWLESYLATGEPRGKAGGYALQEAGSLFVSKVEGSLSNVVGLPLRELLEILASLANLE